MPTPVNMFKTADGQLFEKMADAVTYEQTLFLKEGLAPLFCELFKTCDMVSGAAEGLAARAVAVLGENRELAGNFQKVFNKLQLAPVAPASRSRRPAAKKAAKKTAPPASTPPAGEAGAAPAGGEPSEEHLSGLDQLAGDNPIQIPPIEDAPPSGEAPPPPPQS